MRPFTEQAPKCLLPVHGRPFIDYQLELLGAVCRDICALRRTLGGNGSKRMSAMAATLGMKTRYSWDIPDFSGNG